MRKINKIIIHCSDSGFGDVSIIRKWHLARGWREIGYHYVILNGKRSNKRYNIKNDGLIEGGRELNNDPYLEAQEIGAHASGFNSESIGICLIGIKNFTPKQFESLILFCQYYKKLIPGIEILGHYEVTDKKSCPNIDMKDFRFAIEQITIMNDINHFFNKYF